MLSFAATDLRGETTIYVGKHFEVRDHDQPTKYVFSGSTRVARITGSLSTNTRIQRFRLRPGWNLLSLAVSAPNALRQLTNSQSVVRWDQTTQNWLRISTDEILPAGTVLWVNANSIATLAVTGAYTEPTNRPMPAGDHYFPSAGLEVLPLLGERAGVSADVMLSHFDPFTQHWEQRLPSIPFLDFAFPKFLSPGAAIFVRADAPAELEVPDPAFRIRYYHQDHLGSSSVMTDAGGALVEETAFYPFGEARNEYRFRQADESYKFSQKERDQESGLHHFAARFLAGRLSRFISADPKYLNLDMLSAKDFAAPQALNLYAYVHSNPLKYVDPTGLERIDNSPDEKKARSESMRKARESGVSIWVDDVDWGRVGQVVGGGLTAAGGAALCTTVVLCPVGLMVGAYGSDQVATGLLGEEETLTEKHLGKDFAEGMDLISFAAGGAAMARSIGRGIVAQAAKKGGTQTAAGSATSTSTKTLAGWEGPANPRRPYAVEKMVEKAAKQGHMEMAPGTGMTKAQYLQAKGAYRDALYAEHAALKQWLLDNYGSAKSLMSYIGQETQKKFPVELP